MEEFTKAHAQERFTRLFLREYTDGSYYYVVLRNTEETPAPCCATGCSTPANVRWVDCEDDESGGAPYCTAHHAEHLNFKVEESSGPTQELFYKLHTSSAHKAWTDEVVQEKRSTWLHGWNRSWALFAPYGMFGPGNGWPVDYTGD